MAQGDYTLFQEWLVPMLEDDSNGQRIDLEGDVYKIGLIKSAANGGDDPAAADAAPAWSGGTTNYGTSEVTAGGNYSAGGATISGPTGSEAAGTYTWDDDGSNVSWAQNASNPTNARWGIVYNDTLTIKHAIGFIDLGSDFDMTTGPLTINIAAGGLIQFAIQASV